MKVKPTASESQLEPAASRLRCISCGSVSDSASQNFRCRRCGDLLEAFYPNWNIEGKLRPAGLDAAALKSLWRARRKSLLPIDQSGVWRSEARRGGKDCAVRE